ncbi:MAG: CHAT domain-containing protein [Rhizonema sp. PD38]|nr:CHAT domain-containing protein [Rhizonema sp. PD38]
MQLMPLNRVNLVALVAILATSAISSNSNMSVLLPITRVLAQTPETNTSQAVRLLNLCRADLNKNQDQAALQSCQLAATTAQGKGLRSIQAKSLNNLGKSYQNTGNLQQALSNYQQALVIAQAIKERARISKVLINLGEVANKLGDTAKAKTSFEQALKIGQQINDAQLIIAAKQAQLENNPLKAEADKLIEQGNKRLDTSQFRAALGSYEQALKIYQSIKDHSREENALNGIGLAYFYLGDYKKAIDYQSQSLAIARALKDRLGESQSLNNLGVTYLDSANPKAAEVYLRGAIAVDESIRKDLQNNDAFKISIFETQASSYRLLQQAEVAQNHTLDALLIAERGRTQALIELVASRLGLSSKPIGLSIEQIQHIAQQQNATLVEYSLAGDDLYIWVIKPTGEITFHKVDLKRTKIGNLAENTRVAAATIAESRGVANQIITGLVSKTRSSLNPTQSTSDQHNTSTVRSLDCRGNDCLQQMYQLLIQPIEKQLPTNPDAHVIFIPHQSLFLVPFAALQDKNQQFLIEKHTISIAPSIQVLQLTHQQKLKLQSQQSAAENSFANVAKTAIVVGNPIMPYVSLKIGEPPQQLPALPGAQQEAEQVAQVLQTPVLTKEQASKAAVSKLMQKASIIHLATHGLLDNLEEPGIPGVVALAPSKGDDGLLSAKEVLNLNLNAQLVVLSACDTGRGRITEDSVLGFPRALITAGVPSIIVSLWQVSDQNSTVFLMPEFYRQWKNNPDKAHALRAAMLETKKRYPNPSDWAAFVFIGEAE